MDGASKFVRGDASAGLMITFINVIAGMIIGIAQNDLPFMVAADTYTRLTIGDGLVSQIPALIISVAAGLLVSKAGVSGSADKALFDSSAAIRRRSGCRRPCCSRWACCRHAVHPVHGAGRGDRVRRYLPRMRERQSKEMAEMTMEDAAPAPSPTNRSGPPVDRLGPAGAGLRPADADQYGDEGFRLTDQIKGLRRQLAGEVGFVLPSVRIQDNLQLPPNTYVVRIKEIESGRGDIRPNMLLVMDPRGEAISLPGEPTVEPTFGFTRHVDRAELPRRGAVQGPDRGRCLHRHHNPPDRGHQGQHAGPALLRGDAEAAGRDRAREPEAGGGRHPADHHGRLQRVLQNLLGERVDPRPAHHPEGVSEACGFTRNITAITEHVRTRLARQISESNTNEAGFIPLITLSPDWEQAFADPSSAKAMTGNFPWRRRAFSIHHQCASDFERHAMMGETPVLLTSPESGLMCGRSSNGSVPRPS